LAVDLGSTSFKADIFTPSLKRIGGASELIHYSRKRCFVELEVSRGIKAFSNIITKAVKNAKITGMDITAVGICSQAQTFCIEKDNKFLTPFISWMDTRAVDTAAVLMKERVLSDFAEHASTYDIYPNLQLCQLRAMQDTIPPNARIISLPSMLFRELTGKNVLDENLAAMTGMYSLKTNYWRNETLEITGLNTGQLPELCKLGSAPYVTSNAAKYGIPDGIPVYCCGNDQTAGAYGAGIHSNGSVLLTFGTALVAYVCRKSLPEAEPDLYRGVYPDGLFYSMKVLDQGGALISKIIQEMPVFKDYDTFFKTADQYLYSHNASNSNFDIDINELKKYSTEKCAFYVLNHLANKAYEMVSGLIGDKKLYLRCAGGGSQNKTWLNLLQKKIKCNMSVTRADPVSGIACLINSAINN
jgi:sugar (pentulose or hexulose) kinase